MSRTSKRLPRRLREAHMHQVCSFFTIIFWSCFCYTSAMEEVPCMSSPHIFLEMLYFALLYATFYSSLTV